MWTFLGNSELRETQRAERKRAVAQPKRGVFHALLAPKIYTTEYAHIVKFAWMRIQSARDGWKGQIRIQSLNATCRAAQCV